jgi:O-antigen ligase
MKVPALERSYWSMEKARLILLQAYIAAFFLPIKVSNVAMFALVGLWLITGDWRQTIGELGKKKVVLLILGFYLLHVAGLIFTDNFPSAYKELEKKIPLLLIPLVVVSADDVFMRSARKKLLGFFVKCCVLTCFILLGIAIYRFFMTGNSEVFYFTEFSKVINNFNPIYLAMYVVFAFAIYFYELEPGFSDKVIFKIVFYLVCLFFLVLISSKNSLLVFMIITIHYVFKNIRGFKTRMIVMLAALALVAALISFSTTTKERIRDVIDSDLAGIFEDEYTVNATTFSGLTIRLSFWKVTFKELARENKLLTGVGTGDQYDFLNRVYEPYGLIAAGFVNFNLHNSYMEVLLEHGFFAVIYFLIMWVLFIKNANAGKDQVLMLFVFIFLCFSLTESLLNVNKGIAFFSFWVAFLIKSRSANPAAEVGQV